MIGGNPFDQYALRLTAIAGVAIGLILATPERFNMSIIALSLIAYTLVALLFTDKAVEPILRPAVRTVLVISSIILLVAFWMVGNG